MNDGILPPGTKFGRLEIVRLSYVNKHRSRCYVCRCECGTEKVINRSDLVSGRTKSCGCLQTERHLAATTGRNNHKYKHGGSGTRLLRLWRGMHERCSYDQHISYPYYGGRGVSICAEWHDFATFRTWALASGYKAGLSIDRLNPDGDYSPKNCEWVTRSENTARGNRRRAGTKKQRRECNE